MANAEPIWIINSAQRKCVSRDGPGPLAELLPVKPNVDNAGAGGEDFRYREVIPGLDRTKFPRDQISGRRAAVVPKRSSFKQSHQPEL